MSQQEYHWTSQVRMLAFVVLGIGMLFNPLLAALGFFILMFVLDWFDDGDDDTESEPTATDG